MASKTPSLHAKGAFSLSAPWSLPANVIFECIAIRSFQDFVDKGEDVFTKVYAPKGLDRSVYEADKAAGAKIITLYSNSEALVVVPDTYIASYPSMDTVAYSAVILSIALGAIPDGLDLTFVKEQIKGTVLESLGVTAAVVEHIQPSTGVITSDQHQVLETARQAKITNRTTDRAEKIRLQNLVDEQRTIIQNLETIIRDGGLLPE